MDIWPESRLRSILGVTAHLYKAKGFSVYETSLLDEPFPRQTCRRGNVLAFEEIIQEQGIRQKMLYRHRCQHEVHF